MKKFSTRLKRLIEEKGIKQAELAARASIAQASVSRYINGLQEPKACELHAISKALGVSMDSWFSGLTPLTDADGEDGNWKTRATSAERKLRELRVDVGKIHKKLES